MMLTRILEPEVMDTVQEAVQYDSMDHSEVNRRFVDDLFTLGEPSGEILDLGTGTAQIPVELCRRAASVVVTAVDRAGEMLHIARRNVAEFNLDRRIRLLPMDAKQLSFADETFTAVISNSIVHHIPRPAAVVAEAVRVTAGGGRLFFRDLMRPEDDAAVCRLVETYAAGCSTSQRKMFDDSLRAALSLDEIRDLVASLGFDANSVRATSDRHWTWTAQKPPSHR